MPTEKKSYYKDESFDPIYKTVNHRFYFKSRMLPGTLLALGFLVLGTQVVYPLVYLETHDEANKQVKSSVLGLATGFSEFEFRELDAENNAKDENIEVPTYFTLTIPKLGIKDAQVETNSPSLNPDKSLGHYTGSGLPGRVGNAFIYGHSVLPWFYNPKNYKTIFSTLDQLDTGDTIQINYNGKNYKYLVEGKEILATEKVEPLAEYKPKYLNESTITLMTCWPAGTRQKRLVVRAVVESENQNN